MPAESFSLRTSTQLVDELLKTPWRIHSVLPTMGIAGIFGASCTGKSFLALDMAAAVAEGREWFGHATMASQVAYVTFDGEASLCRRVAAWRRHHQRPFPSNVLFVLDDGFQLTSPDHALGLAESIEDRGGAGTVIIDSLAHAAPGEDVTSLQSVDRILEGVRELQSVADCAVVLVHCMPAGGPLCDALDVVLEVTGRSGWRGWRLARSKDAPGDTASLFRLCKVHLGEDEDGHAITSCVVERSSDVVED